MEFTPIPHTETLPFTRTLIIETEGHTINFMCTTDIQIITIQEAIILLLSCLFTMTDTAIISTTILMVTMSILRIHRKHKVGRITVVVAVDQAGLSRASSYVAAAPVFWRWPARKVGAKAAKVMEITLIMKKSFMKKLLLRKLLSLKNITIHSQNFKWVVKCNMANIHLSIHQA